MGSITASCRGARVALLCCAFALALTFGTPAAFAASTYFEQTPGVGGVSTVAMPLVSVKVSDPAGISTGYQLKIDGVTRTPKVKWASDGSYVQMYYQTVSPLSNGNHTVYASVFTGAGRTSTTWSFIQRVQPVVGPMAPADGSTTDTQYPTISAVVTPNGGSVASYTMTVDGLGVIPTYNAATKTVSYTPARPLRNDTSHRVSLTVVDNAGATTTVAWDFTVQIYADMLDTAGCTDCHTTYPVAHPTSACMKCHEGSGPAPAYWNMDDLTPVHGSEMIEYDCVYCHASVFPSVPTHPADVSTLHPSGNMSGCACHVSDLTTEHNRYLTEAGTPITCSTCHESTDPRIQAGMAMGSPVCADCHEIPAGHPLDMVDHVADVADELDASGLRCSQCHEMDLVSEHQPETRSPVSVCDTCHATPRDSFDSWAQSCSQGGCHAAGGPTQMHGQISAAHSAPVASCGEEGCHVIGDVSTLHSEASTSTVDGDFASCTVCHRSGIALTKECADCHADRLVPHGYDAVRHTSSESCIGQCHSAELRPAHNAQVTQTVATACPGCHSEYVPAIAPWDGTCSACHATIAPATHTTPGGSHAGSDALVRDYTNNFPIRTSMSTRSYPFGCTPTPSTGQTVCHDVSNLATLHQALPGKGCSVCHAAAGATQAGANECLTCHGTGWYSPAASKGTIARPGSDFSSSGIVSAVGGTGTSNYSTLVSNDGATSYLRFGSVNAEAMFGRGSWWMNPNTTSVTSVQVLFRAMKLAAGTTNSRMTVVMNVGGTTYVSAAAVTNPSATAYTQYTYTFTTNPKTGLAWTPADLNDPNSANGLRAFGVRQTAADTANIGVTEVYLKVNTPDTNYAATPSSGGTAHHYGDYLRSPQTPSGEWSSAIYTQYCYDRCHVYPNTYAYYGEVLSNPLYSPFRAYEGTQMWSSLMGDPNGNSPVVRNLTLNSVELPAGAPTLSFMTNYVLGTGDAGYVEVSTDDGSSWTTLTGTVAGSSVSAFTGTAGSWRQADYDLSAYAGQTVNIRFRYTNTAYATTAGWCIDNVNISEGGTVVFSDDAETLKPDWDSGSHWRRIQYALRWLG